MNLEDINQDSTEMFNFDEIENDDLKLSEETSTIVKKDSSTKKEKHKCKFSAGTKLSFWVGMLFLGLVLGAESWFLAIEKTISVHKEVQDKETGAAIFHSFLVMFLWIEAIFYFVIISWSIWGTTKNGIIVGKKRKAKKQAKLANADETVKKDKKSKKSKKTKKEENK